MNLIKIASNIFVTLVIVFICLYVGCLVIAVAYKDDPTIRAAVKSITVSAANLLSSSKEANEELLKAVKKELKGK